MNLVLSLTHKHSRRNANKLNLQNISTTHLAKSASQGVTHPLVIVPHFSIHSHRHDDRWILLAVLE